MDYDVSCFLLTCGRGFSVVQNGPFRRVIKPLLRCDMVFIAWWNRLFCVTFPVRNAGGTGFGAFLMWFSLAVAVPRQPSCRRKCRRLILVSRSVEGLFTVNYFDFSSVKSIVWRMCSIGFYRQTSIFPIAGIVLNIVNIQFEDNASEFVNCSFY